MDLKVAANSFHLSQPSFPQSPSSSQALASAIASLSSSSSSKRHSFLLCHNNRSALFGTHYTSSHKSRSRSFDDLRRFHVRKTIRRALSASLDSFPEEEFSKEIQESFESLFEEHSVSSGEVKFLDNNAKSFSDFEHPSFPERDETTPDDIERKANSLDIPLSLRIIKRKKQWQNGLIHAGESAYCSIKKAFSSMVFIIRELHSYSLQTREILFYEDLQGILSSVQKEMNASFVWLFQKIFSQTPTLMVYLMILLANYSVYSMLNNTALAAAAPPPAVQVSTTTVEDQSHVKKPNFDSSVVKTFKLSSSSGKTTSIGANGGGGGKYKPVTSGTDGDGIFDDESKNYYSAIINPDSSVLSSSEGDSVSMQVSGGEETNLWDLMIDEASKMRGGELDHETMQRFISPVDAKIEADDKLEYVKTEFLYQTGLAREPFNPLLLANYAQFLFIVAQDYDRAEEYFKRATQVKPKDAEALNKYANFLWLARKDLLAAEDTYLEAIDVEPENSHYAANYAHFLWNTGGEDTCFPLD